MDDRLTGGAEYGSDLPAVLEMWLHTHSYLRIFVGGIE